MKNKDQFQRGFRQLAKRHGIKEWILIWVNDDESVGDAIRVCGDLHPLAGAMMSLVRNVPPMKNFLEFVVEHINGLSHICPECREEFETPHPTFLGVDTSINMENKIEKFMHCGRCLEERSESQSPQDYRRYDVGLTSEGVQIWCTRHNFNIAHFKMIEKEEEDTPHGH